MKAEPPAPPRRDDVLVENGAASTKSCLPSLEIRITTVAGGLLPTDETSTPTKITFNEPPLRFYSIEETNLKETNVWTSVPSAWYDSSGEINSLLPPPAGGLSRHNRCKMGRPIQAVRKIVSALARLWDRGARCFVVRLYVLERLGEAASFFEGSTLRY